MAIYEYCIMLLLKSPGNFIHLHLRVIRTSDNWLNIWEEFPHTQYIFLLMIIYKNSYSLTKKNYNTDFYFVIKKTIHFLEMEIGTFSCHRITTIFCHTWSGVYLVGIGSRCCSVWPCTPTKYLEQIYVHRVTFSTVKSSRPYARIQRWHCSKFRFGLPGLPGSEVCNIG